MRSTIVYHIHIEPNYWQFMNFFPICSIVVPLTTGWRNTAGNSKSMNVLLIKSWAVSGEVLRCVLKSNIYRDSNTDDIVLENANFSFQFSWKMPASVFSSVGKCQQVELHEIP